MKLIVKVLFVMLLANVTFGQSTSNVEVLKIKTSAECGSCKIRIEDKLNYTAGIKFAELDVPSKVLTVKYVVKKISPDEIRKIVSELGYDADKVKAVPSAVEKLPGCCKPGGMK